MQLLAHIFLVYHFNIRFVDAAFMRARTHWFELLASGGYFISNEWKLEATKKVRMTVGMLGDFGYIFHQGISPVQILGSSRQISPGKRAGAFGFAPWWLHEHAFLRSVRSSSPPAKRTCSGVVEEWLSRRWQLGWARQPFAIDKQLNNNQWFEFLNISMRKMYSFYWIYWNASAKLNVINQGSSALVNDWRSCASCWVEQPKMQFFSMKSILFYKLV